MSQYWKGLGSALRGLGQGIEAVGRGLQGGVARDALPKHQTLAPFAGKRPTLLADNVFVAPNALVLGDVTIGPNSSVWYGAVVRGDVNSVKIGAKTNVQDCVTVHVAKLNIKGQPAPTLIGDNCTIGHGAVLHACTIEDGCLVGMGATLLDGAKVGQGAIVAAGAVVPPGTAIPGGEIWAGVPAKFLRKAMPEEASFISLSAANYAELAAVHAAENSKTFEEIEVDKARREDRLVREPDYDQHLGLERDPITREITAVAQST